MGKSIGIALRKLYLALAVIALVGVPQMASAVQIDVLVLYDDYSASRLGGEPAVVMRSWQDQINSFYRNSGIDLQMRMVAVERFNASGANMSSVVNTITASSEVAQMRNRVGADFVTQLHQTGSCGVGWAAVDARYAFNVIGASCGPMAMAHELGHNMGLNHSRTQGDRSGVVYPYGLGHLEVGVFGTIMSYAQQYRTKWLPVFSNPDKMCEGRPCGVPEGEADQADARKAVNNVKAKLAAFRATVVPGSGDDDDQCQVWSATNDQHVTAGRAFRRTYSMGCEPAIPEYVAVGSNERIGESGSAITTLYSADGELTFHLGDCPDNGTADADGDGYGTNADCSDANPDIHPGAEEICGDNVDQDCSGSDRACTGSGCN
jgi:hypothetical protein